MDDVLNSVVRQQAWAHRESQMPSSKTLHSHGLLAPVSAPANLAPSAISHVQGSGQGAGAQLTALAPQGPIIRRLSDRK